MVRILPTLLFLLCFSSSLFGQKMGVLHLESNFHDAHVFVDSLYFGKVSEQPWEVEAGTHHVQLVAHSNSWEISPIDTTVTIQEHKPSYLSLNFLYLYKVTTIPFGAKIMHHTSDGFSRTLGTTPLIYKSDSLLTGSISVELIQYESQSFELGTDVIQSYTFSLHPISTSSNKSVVDWTPPQHQKKWISYLAGTIALGSAIYSIQNKFKADNLYDQYVETGDPTLRPQFEDYDKKAAWGLGIMQAGLGVVVLRLVLR